MVRKDLSSGEIAIISRKTVLLKAIAPGHFPHWGKEEEEIVHKSNIRGVGGGHTVVRLNEPKRNSPAIISHLSYSPFLPAKQPRSQSYAAAHIVLRMLHEGAPGAEKSGCCFETGVCHPLFGIFSFFCRRCFPVFSFPGKQERERDWYENGRRTEEHRHTARETTVGRFNVRFLTEMESQEQG